MPRKSWDESFLDIARVVAERATCDRLHCGCVLVKDRRILATGYNGSLPGQPHCDDAGHDMDAGHCVRVQHAESNAVAHAARAGTSLAGSEAYVTHLPCWPCFKLLVSAGVTAIYYGEAYRTDERVRRAAAGVNGFPFTVVRPAAAVQEAPAARHGLSGKEAQNGLVSTLAPSTCPDPEDCLLCNPKYRSLV